MDLGWLWGVLAAISFRWIGKMFRKVTHRPPTPLPVEIVSVRGLSEVESDEVRALPEATDASISFLRAGMRLLTHLGIVDALGIPPSVQGALWSWPQVFRSLRILVESSSQLAEEVLIIRAVGSTQLADAAFDAAQHLAQLMKQSQPTRWQPRHFVPNEKLEEAVAALAAFRRLMRSELERSDDPSIERPALGLD
jgi:hypothetical protein